VRRRGPGCSETNGRSGKERSR